jgi:hypothetical protein
MKLLSAWSLTRSMSDLTPVSRDDGHELRELLAQFDAPAYVRRARQVEGAYEQLIDRCRRQRHEWLSMARTRLGQLLALGGGRDELARRLADDSLLAILWQLHDELRPALRMPVVKTESIRILRRAVDALRLSIERFNHRWRAFLDKQDLQTVNALRDGYNRYYILEKECAVRSARIAREGFRPLRPLTIRDLEAVLPPLPVPCLVGDRQ